MIKCSIADAHRQRPSAAVAVRGKPAPAAGVEIEVSGAGTVIVRFFSPWTTTCQLYQWGKINFPSSISTFRIITWFLLIIQRCKLIQRRHAPIRISATLVVCAIFFRITPVFIRWQAKGLFRSQSLWLCLIIIY